MELKVIATVFITVFLAELGDKTQLATLLFAADEGRSKWMVFFAASAALIATTAIAVLVGGTLEKYISTKMLSMVAGVGFIVIGGWTLWQGISAAPQ